MLSLSVARGMGGAQGEFWDWSWDWFWDWFGECMLKALVRLEIGSGDSGLEWREIFEGPSFSDES